MQQFIALLRERSRERVSLSVLFSALKTALVVGTVLTTINQFEAVVYGELPLQVVKALLSYSVPFMVFLYGRLTAPTFRSTP
ncbi:nitrate/nitrite transporter NrtS [Alteromonas gilva]|uniref:Nitrate/nitrite transporter NrtS n=1 Tax=Alteromonas gilva TaxID=2987522 RepID=A0ABT5KYD2_9ALTE|nr:nitrate/nitrite transporter NrtS [Alteromonas gilva]MDC8829784.1 nitrate/nitrite transporter NrtS [Alteromonas gilva]